MRLKLGSSAKPQTERISGKRPRRPYARPNHKAKTGSKLSWPDDVSRMLCKWRAQPELTEGTNMPTTQEIPATSPIGRDTPRVDGPLKVTGRAQYTSDFHFPGLLYAIPVEATIANGRVVKLDTAAAEKMPGVRAIFHRQNIGKIFRSVNGPGLEGICDE